MIITTIPLHDINDVTGNHANYLVSIHIKMVHWQRTEDCYVDQVRVGQENYKKNEAKVIEQQREQKR